MTLIQKKIDVTDRVIGKLKNGQIELYLENSSIGKITFPGNIELDHHFEAEQRKIYQNVSVPDNKYPRYTDCDEGGWC
jgi:uncharacterized protein YpmS